MENAMSTMDTAKSFTDALKKQDYAAAEAHWSDDVVSFENMEGPMQRLEGRAAVHGKSAWWFDNHTIHSFGVQGPYVSGDQFALQFKIDVTNKQSGQRMAMDEIGLYTVRNGKVIEERFFNGG
jgi:ketosteroid isomerase-like protein